MTRGEILNKVRDVLENLDNLAECWGDEAVFRRCRDQLREIANAPCKHENETVTRYGAFMGTVACNDCGRERDWGAY